MNRELMNNIEDHLRNGINPSKAALDGINDYGTKHYL